MYADNFPNLQPDHTIKNLEFSIWNKRIESFEGWLGGLRCYFSYDTIDGFRAFAPHLNQMEQWPQKMTWEDWQRLSRDFILPFIFEHATQGKIKLSAHGDQPNKSLERKN